MKKLNDKSVAKMFTTVNPFLLRQQNNPDEYCIFNRPVDCYYHVLVTFFRNCSKGYIELPYILWKIYPTKRKNEIKELVEAMEKLGVPYVSVLSYDTKRATIYFEQFFTALHSVCDTEMNHEAFKQALTYSKHLTDVLKEGSNTL